MIQQTDFSQKVVFFLAQGFSDKAYLSAIQFFSRRNIGVSIVGQNKAIIVGEDGLRVEPDFLLSQLEEICGMSCSPIGLVLGGGLRCMNLLIADPRVHHWISRYGSSGWGVGALRPLDYNMMIQLTRTTMSNMMIQNDSSYDEFLNQYTSVIAKAKFH